MTIIEALNKFSSLIDVLYEANCCTEEEISEFQEIEEIFINYVREHELNSGIKGSLSNN